jgi:DNA invertase Pin-like site-specific DNA recombinase
MRVALYARISTATKGQDIELQLTEMRQYAKARSWSIVAEYSDVASGVKCSRPQLDKLMSAAKQQQIDAVLVWKLDRFGRSLKHLVNAISDLESLKIAFVSVRDNIDLSTPAGRLLFHLLGAVAEFERGLIAERVKAGMKHARSKGIVSGPKPRLIDKQLVSDLMSQGLPMREIARRANTSIGTLYRQAIN